MALNIGEPWSVEDIRFDPAAKRLDIFIDFRKGAEFTYYDTKAGQEYVGLKAYDTKEKVWRHLNFFEHECYLHARVPRVKLPDGKVKRIKTPWEGLSNGFTLLFEALVLQLCHSMPVRRVGAIIDVDDDKLWRMLERYIGLSREEEDFSAVEAVGIDETSRAKGHEYVTLFVDLHQRKTLFVTEGKGADTIGHFTKDFEAHDGSTGKIADVSCDMSPAFIKGVRTHLPAAEITFDRFHILKIVNEAVDAVRREESKADPALKGTRYLWLKNPDRLTARQKAGLASLSMAKRNLKTLRAYHIKTSFQDIYKAQSEEEFTICLRKWYYWATHSRLKPIIEAAKTIRRHWDGVVNWYRSRINNGILEGLNSSIQAAKSKARGYRTFRNFKIIIYLLTGKLDFSRINPAFQRI